MFFPYATDTPVRFFPYVTIVLMLVNVAVFSLGYNQAERPEIADEWALEYGRGLQPSQWLSANFIHAGPYHVFMNVVFLWVFGLLVEGKAGWIRMGAIYFGIILLQSVLEQTLMSFGPPRPGSLGASAAVYGLMAIAFVWAPKSEFDCFWFALFFWGSLSVPFVVIAFLFLVIDQVALSYLSQYEGVNWLRVLGTVIGLPIGIVLLQTGQIARDGWDLFHIWSGKYGATVRKRQSDFEREIDQHKSREQTKQAANAIEQVTALLDQGHPVGASRVVRKLEGNGVALQLDDELLIRLTQALHEADQWGESAPYMAKMIDRFPDRADLLRLKLAQVCVVELQRPGRALDLLSRINKTNISEEDNLLRRAIRHKAQQLQQDDLLVEIDDEEW